MHLQQKQKRFSKEIHHDVEQESRPIDTLTHVIYLLKSCYGYVFLLHLVRFMDANFFTGKSCMDWYMAGMKANGLYQIKPVSHGNVFTVYCDFRSEPKSVWTLVMSYTLSNKMKKPLYYSAADMEDSPNWEKYRYCFQIKNL